MCASGLVCPAGTLCPPPGAPDVCIADDCGNGDLDPGEECDPGDPNNPNAPPQDTASCDRDCTLPRCGDALPNQAANEQCDDGGESPSCNVNCTFSRCGDSIVNVAAGEDCEPTSRDSQGNPLDEQSCDHDCTFRECSDGYTSLAMRNGNRVELCDDGNALACGTCSDDCYSERTPTRATGIITPTTGSNLIDGETFTMDDGIHPSAVFEFDIGGTGVALGNIPVPLPSGAFTAQVAAVIRAVINNVGLRLLVTATSSGNNQVTVTHDLPGFVGNTFLTEQVGNGTFAASVTQPGSSADCPTAPTTGCVVHADCKSRYCNYPIGVPRGTCQPCTQPSDCQSGYCETATGTCLPFECQGGADCSSGYCQVTSGSTGGTCTPCTSGANCSSGYCNPTLNGGTCQPCTVNTDCTSGICNSGICQ